MSGNNDSVPQTPRYISIELNALAKILLKISASENPSAMARDEAIGVLSMERGRFSELDAAYERSINQISKTANRQAEYRKRIKERPTQDAPNAQEDARKPSTERKTRTTFIAPSHNEISLFASDSGLPISCVDAFWDYYESKGWKVGNVKMSDWKAAYRGWVRRDVQMPSAQEVQRFCSEKGVDQTKARAFYRELSSVGWKYRGQKIVDWKPLFLEIKP